VNLRKGIASEASGVRLETEDLTAYSAFISFQHFFALVGIKKRLRGCFRHPKVSPICDHHATMMRLAVHLVTEHRKLRDV
jgi:hypothetical protein